MDKRPKLNQREAAKELARMGAGKVVLHRHDDTLVTVTAISAYNVSAAQQTAEALLEDLKRRYRIVRD